MSAKMRLMFASVFAAVVVANAIPMVSAAFGALSWAEVIDGMPVFNLVFVVPAVPAALLSAWMHAHEPDAREGTSSILAASLVLVAFVVYFLATLAWVPVVGALSDRVLPATMPMPHLPQGAATTLFQTLLLAFIAAFPAWVLGVAAVRWARFTPAREVIG